MIRKAKIGGEVFNYDLCSKTLIEDNKKKQLVLLGLGSIDSINGIKQNNMDELFFYVYKNKILLLNKKMGAVGKKFLNTREYRIETFVGIDKWMIITDQTKVHLDYFNEFYEMVDEDFMRCIS
ncbi:MAG: hypothetical protein PHI02_09385 [Sulfurovaceae bacterium]|nr:hypothetical protein [Sulfurovaceae bacterium]